MRLVALSAGICFLLDQVSKYVIVHVMGLAERGVIEVFPPFLSFRMGWNTGINFGLFGGDAGAGRWVLIGIALAICAGVLWWLRREPATPRVMIAAGALLGGALGNVLDRVLYGAVADFLNMSCCGIVNPFTFNIADVAIFLGAIGLALWGGKAQESA